MSSFYQINLAVLAAGNAFLLYKRYGPGGQQKKAAQQAENASANGHSKPTSSAPEKDNDDIESARTSLDSNTPSSSANGTLLSSPDAAAAAAARKFQIEYFAVYILAVAADWLQGPHIYAIYKYEKQIPERLVAALYAAGFIAGAVSASIAGNLADRHGRRLACMVYCASTALACLSMLSNNLVVLTAGRLCGGVSTTLLFSVFEAWMISEYRSRGLQNSGLSLGDIFGLMTTLSCITAIVSGILGEVLVAQFGGRVWPFLAAAGCATGAAYLILSTWRENYGAKSANTSATATTTSVMSSGIINGIADTINTARIIIRHAGILSLGIASCVFEGTMYLVVFFWSAALQSARRKAGGPLAEQELPFGIIFSSFMCAMMAGGTFFSLRNVTTRGQGSVFDNAGFLLAGVVLLVSISLSLAVVASTSEALIFWAVCIVEACIGIYYPSMSLLKSEVVEDDVRGRVYSLLRMPLNVFVVVAHAMDEEGDGHRNRVFLTLAGLLMVSFFVVKRHFISA